MRSAPGTAARLYLLMTRYPPVGLAKILDSVPAHATGTILTLRAAQTTPGPGHRLHLWDTLEPCPLKFFPKTVTLLDLAAPMYLSARDFVRKC